MSQLIPNSKELETVLSLVSLSRAVLRDLASEGIVAYRHRGDKTGVERVTNYANQLSDHLKKIGENVSTWQEIGEALAKYGDHRIKLVARIDERIAELETLKALIEGKES